MFIQITLYFAGLPRQHYFADIWTKLQRVTHKSVGAGKMLVHLEGWDLQCSDSSVL